MALLPPWRPRAGGEGSSKGDLRKGVEARGPESRRPKHRPRGPGSGELPVSHPAGWPSAAPSWAGLRGSSCRRHQHPKPGAGALPSRSWGLWLLAAPAPAAFPEEVLAPCRGEGTRGWLREESMPLPGPPEPESYCWTFFSVNIMLNEQPCSNISHASDYFQRINA